ncbi:MAG: aldo/keto reductase [Alicyclobacillus mali]|nr:aldo/keto reductase [Alicyclobacillus mali (ex Roth et al. 2021)]MCL6489456.1 aldo/keto reductase [Alicyclobacillus mali (ex Roth et al. 2021)]
MKYRKLLSLDVSILSLGASPFGGVFGDVEESSCINCVHAALDRGINYIDVAPYYGNTRAEAILGKALRGVPRDRYLLSTKAGRITDSHFDFSSGHLKRSVEQSLRRLGTDFVDILYLHDIEFAHPKQIFEEAIPCAIRLRDEGKVRFVGVSGYPLSVLERTLDSSDIEVVLSYCHYTIIDNSLSNLVPKVKAKGVGLVNASPLGMGLLTEVGPPSWHPADKRLRTVCKTGSDYCIRHGTSIAKIALQFSVSNEDVPTTLIGAASPETIMQNIKWIEEPLDEEMLRELKGLFSDVEGITWGSGNEEDWRDVG